MQEAFEKMGKLRIGAMVISGVLALGVTSPAWAAAGGDANPGDVWLDNAGQPAGPGHEMDPHLACQDTIDLWGSGLSDSSGTFTIDGWPPSGSQEVDYSGTWSYSQSSSRQSGDQSIAVISVSQLIDQAVANGDSAGSQDFHFKLDFSQDPQKHKTFWLDCTSAPSGGGGGNGGSTGGGSGGGGGGNSGGGSTGGGNSGGGGSGCCCGSTTGGSTGGGVTTSSVITTSTGSVKTAIGAITASRPRTHTAHKSRKRHKRPRRARRHKAAKRHVRVVSVNVRTFAG